MFNQDSASMSFEPIKHSSTLPPPWAIVVAALFLIGMIVFAMRQSRKRTAANSSLKLNG